MNRFRRALASLLLLAVGFGGTTTSTSASFTAAASVPGNSIATGTLTPPALTASVVNSDRATLAWDGGPAGGAAPTYSLTRTDPGGATTVLAAGTATTLTDPGNLPTSVRDLHPTAVVAGGSHSLALDDTGDVWAWGQNTFGQLGDGTTTQRGAPVQVAFPAGVRITTISAGNAHSLALDDTGDVWAWGNNYNGQLGNGTNSDSNVPVNITSATDTLNGGAMTVIAAGGSHSLALDANTNTLWAWGNNWSGQLGNGTNSDSNVPANITAATTTLEGKRITAIAAGASHSLALTEDNGGSIVWAWGKNDAGQLGNGTKNDRNTPADVTTPRGSKLAGTTITAISAGTYHSLALDGKINTVWAWGSNSNGQIGDGANSGSTTPVNITTATDTLRGVTITEISAGYTHSLALDDHHNVWAWGNNWNGQLGNGKSRSNSDSEVPVNITERDKSTLAGVTVDTISAGSAHSLALDAGHAISAWGYSANGQLGNGMSGVNPDGTTNSDAPVTTILTDRIACTVGAGRIPGQSTCSLTADTTYTYTVTTSIGGWTTTSRSLSVKTKAAP